MKATANLPKTAKLEKSIEVSKRRIEEFASKVETYKARFDKKNVYGFKLSDLDIESVSYKTRYQHNESVYKGWAEQLKNQLGEREYFGIYFDLKEYATRYTDNIEAGKSEKENLIKLTTKLTQANLAINEQKSKEDNPQGLRKVLIDALADYKVYWFEYMKKWYSERYDYLWEKKPVWYAWVRKYNKLINRHYHRLNRYSGNHIKLCLRLDEKYKRYSKCLCSPELHQSDKNRFMEDLERDLIWVWKSNMNKLVEKCEKFNIDLEKIEVYNPKMESRGFSVLIRDGKPRVIDVRTIIAAETSILVTPHTRYIVTERKTKR